MRQPETQTADTSNLKHHWEMGFGKVQHTRVRPVKHSFVYPSFFVDGNASTMLQGPCGTWLFGVNRRAVISVHAKDHGEGLNNLNWIKQILGDANLPQARTIRFRGFPRVFGYAFKPVSFWFCADSQDRIFAVIAEVNNTFGERHCYLLTSPDHSFIKNGELLLAKKSFHVSPFREISGRYQFRFTSKESQSAARVDHHQTDDDILHTSISGTHMPLNQSACLRAVFCYPLFSVGVIARIHWQALRLWFKRLPFVSKPLAPKTFATQGSGLKEE